MGKLKDFFFGKEEQPIGQNVDLAQRSFNVPEKVFVEPEGLFHEWSEQEPASLRHRVNDLLYGSYSSNNFIELFYCLPEVFAPVHEIAKRVSDANWQLRKDWNDEIDYKDETFNKLFSQPNPFESFKDMVYQAVCYEILTGKQFFFFNRPDSLPNEYKSIITWYNLIAHQVTADLKKGVDPYTATELNDLVREYRMPLNDGIRRFPADKVLPVCHLGLSSGYNLNDCKSLLLGADKAIRNLIPVYEARGVIYVKRGALGFLVGNKSDASGQIPLTKPEKQEVIQDFQATYGITGGKSPVGITRQPLQWVQTAMSIKELEPFEETLADAVAIYKVLRVPRHLVPSKDNSTFANADADLKSFYQDVIIPWAKRYAEMWTSYMNLKDARRYIHADYSHIDILQENRKEKADVGKILSDTYLQNFLNGMCSLNEAIVMQEGTKGTLPLYDKKIFEMEPEELEIVKAGLTMKAPAIQPVEEKEEAIVSPMKKVV